MSDRRLGDESAAHCDLTGHTPLWERGVFLATGAYESFPGSRVGGFAYVGAGSVVIRSVAAGQKVFGNPARVLLAKVSRSSLVLASPMAERLSRILLKPALLSECFKGFVAGEADEELLLSEIQAVVFDVDQCAQDVMARLPACSRRPAPPPGARSRHFGGCHFLHRCQIQPAGNVRRRV